MTNLRPDQTRMIADESRNSCSRLTGHESCTRVDENYERLNKMAERFSDTQEKPEASDVQVFTHNKNKKKKRKYYYVSSTSDSWSNDSDCQQFDKREKRRKRSGEATSKNKEIEKGLSSTLMQLSLLVWPSNESWGNTHANSRLPTLIDSHPLLIQDLVANFTPCNNKNSLILFKNVLAITRINFFFYVIIS